MFSYSKFEQLCNERRLSTYKVSSSTGVASSTLSMWKSGKYTPKIDKIQKIADFFEVPITDFLDNRKD